MIRVETCPAMLRVSLSLGFYFPSNPPYDAMRGLGPPQPETCSLAHMNEVCLRTHPTPGVLKGFPSSVDSVETFHLTPLMAPHGHRKFSPALGGKLGAAGPEIPVIPNAQL